MHLFLADASETSGDSAAIKIALVAEVTATEEAAGIGMQIQMPSAVRNERKRVAKTKAKQALEERQAKGAAEADIYSNSCHRLPSVPRFPDLNKHENSDMVKLQWKEFFIGKETCEAQTQTEAEDEEGRLLDPLTSSTPTGGEG